MRLMKKEKGDDSGAEPEKSDSNAGPVPASPSRPTESESRTDPTVPTPAGWYPDPHNRGVARYWDGATWAERTQPLPAPPPAPPHEKPSGAMRAATTASESPDVMDSRSTKPTHESAEAASPPGLPNQEADKDAHVWVGATKAAVGNALAVGTPEAWLSAAQTAVVVAEMSYAMQLATHARQIATQAIQRAEVADQEAHALTEAAAEAMRTAQQSAQAAEVAEREARDAAKAATSARRQAEEMAASAPLATDDARVLVEAAKRATATADELEGVVVQANEANTPEAWHEALQHVAALWSKKVDEH
jgi:hypothetical protein